MKSKSFMCIAEFTFCSELANPTRLICNFVLGYQLYRKTLLLLDDKALECYWFWLLGENDNLTLPVLNDSINIFEGDRLCVDD